MGRALPLLSFEIVAGEDAEETRMLRDLAEEARTYLLEHRWCNGVRRLFLGLGIGGVVGVALAQIEPGAEDVDAWLWVVVGDLPPLYLTTDTADDPAEALEVYIELMREWVEAVRSGGSLDDLPPVGAEPTEEHALMLASRMDLLEEEVVPRYRQGESGLRRREGAAGEVVYADPLWHAVRLLLDGEGIWGLADSDGWALAVDDEDRDVLPVWVERSLAEEAVAGEAEGDDWAGAAPRRIELDKWRDEVLPGVRRRGERVLVHGVGLLVASVDPATFERELG